MHPTLIGTRSQRRLRRSRPVRDVRLDDRFSVNRRILDYIEKASQATSSDELGELLAAELKPLGFENFVFVETVQGEIQDVVWAKLPDGYANEYMSRNWRQIDPVMRHAMSTGHAFAWEKTLRTETLSYPQRDFMGASAELGVQGGVTAAIHGPGGRADLLSLSMRDGVETPPVDLVEIHVLLFHAWLRRSVLRPAGRQPVKPIPAAPRVSPRERECLLWLKEGKTNWEISEILGVSEKTAEFHVRNLMRKFGADSQLGVVVAALHRGAVSL